MEITNELLEKTRRHAYKKAYIAGYIKQMRETGELLIDVPFEDLDQWYRIQILQEAIRHYRMYRLDIQDNSQRYQKELEKTDI